MILRACLHGGRVLGSPPVSWGTLAPCKQTLKLIEARIAQFQVQCYALSLIVDSRHYCHASVDLLSTMTLH